LAEANFGCGSSREHAPWALDDFGFKVILSPSFADIFYSNCFKNGMLPIQLSEAVITDLFRRTTEHVGYTLTVDLVNKTIIGSDGLILSFDLEENRRQFLLHGLDEIGQTMKYEKEITEYEHAHSLV